MLDVADLNKNILILERADEASRRQIVRSLSEHEEQEWATVPSEVIQLLVKILKPLLRSDMRQPYIHKDVATILGNMGLRSKSAIPQLTELLKESIPDAIREAAVAALGKMGKEARVAVGSLLQLLETCRPALAAHVIRALGNIGGADQRIRSTLAKLWLSPTQFQGSQAQVAIALCKLKIDTPGLPAMLARNLVANQENSQRKSAAEALAWCDKEEIDVVPALLTATLSDTNDEVRQTAQAGLDHLRLSKKKAIGLCAKQLKDSQYAEAALRKSGPEAIPALTEALAAEETAVRLKAARILGCLGESAAEAAPALNAALHDKDKDVRLAAAKSLWAVAKEAEAVVSVMVQLLAEGAAASADAGEPRRQFLQAVIEALGRMGPPAKAAVPALRRLLKDKNRHVAESAQNTLKMIDLAAPATRQ